MKQRSLNRQGGETSWTHNPYLFIFCMERPGHMINMKMSKKGRGLKISASGPMITHLFFADNLLLFFDDPSSNLVRGDQARLR